jgi:glycosyltransferase involved in cell wall biosynthesis
MTKVSVIIPTYNCAQYIVQGIESVLNQTYKDIEILVIDDGSSDNTKELLQPYMEKGFVRYFYQKNKGPSAARNRGIMEAEGEYLAFLDADDLWKEEKLGKSINFMENYGFDWICTSMIRITPKGEEIIKRIPEDSWVLNSQTKEIKQLKNGLFFFSDIPVHTPTIVVKKKCFEKVGIFDESFLIGEDTDLWLRFEEEGLKGGYLDEPLTIYRYNEKSLTKGGRVDGLKEHAKVAKKHASILGLKKPFVRKSYAEFLWQVAGRYYTCKRYCNSIKYILLSISYDISKLKKLINKLCTV